MAAEPVLEVRDLSKTFPSTGTVALSGVSLSLSAGEIHAVVGENGAGKSTLARILAGLDRPDSGRILVRGREVRFRRPRDAERLGIGMVPQQSLLAPGLSVAENVVLGHEPRLLGILLDRRRAYYETALASANFSFPLDPGSRISRLSPPERREAEIVRALARGGDVLILDEPTSILTESEAETLYGLLKRLRDAGASVILISHRVREVLSAADRITILRNGSVVDTILPAETDDCDLALRMASSASCFTADGPAESGGQAVFRFLGANFRDSERVTLRDLGFTVRRGEIYGIAALAGNGLGALEDLACGERICDSGAVELLGRNLVDWPRDELRASALSYLPTDRDGRGLCLGATILENLAARIGSPGDWSRRGRAARRAEAFRLLEDAGGRAPPDAPIDMLSGGNRQRVLCVRELGTFTPAVLAANPTQGLDPRAQEETWNRLRSRAREGAGILLLTSSVDELFSVADRVAVLYRGRLTELGIRTGSVTAEAVTRLLTGAAA
ncbi:MAG TPA: ATP-binding cassette domain-containing protein [Spirochaetia bacterium]|nr:ATP-binding cassette domain-containing protein [Spirochaetales bacterium]HRY81655.1 ATP-binding cassette domain-containing protein [Spirochaetia bacterium]